MLGYCHLLAIPHHLASGSNLYWRRWQLPTPICSCWKEEEKPPFAYKWAHVKRAKREWVTWEVQRVEEKEKRERAAMAARVMGVEWWDPPPYIYCNPFSISNEITLSRGCRWFSEPRKILCLSVLSLLWAKISTSPVAGFRPTIGIRADGLSGVWFFAQK